MESGKHNRADRIRIAQVSGLARHRDTQHRDRWDTLIAQLREVTADPHLLAHAAASDDPPEVDELLRLAGADMEEVALQRAAGRPVSQLAVLADRLGDQHVIDKARRP